MKRNHFILKIIFILVAFFSFEKIAAQVVVNVLLQPPYSPYFSDYLTYENKTVITFSNSGFSSEIYLKGSIVGDNGVEIRTKDGYKPGAPLIINAPGVTVLNGADIVEYFEWSNVTTKGVEIANIIQNNGLPEGTYTICLEAIDFRSNASLSNPSFGCFTFKIIQVEPPVLSFPMCKGKVISTVNQNIAFSWFPSPGGPPNTRYLFTMVPLLNPDQNPNDALNGATSPAFFEKEVIAPVLIYGLADPLLVPGTAYAWRVQAFDPLNKVVFRNNGISEACSFLYAADPMIGATTVDMLRILTPNCKSENDTVFISKSGDLSLNWGWKQQEDDPSLMLNPEKLKINGRAIQNYTVVLTPNWKSKSGMPPLTVIKRNVSAPTQFVKFTAANIINLGIQKNLPYTMQVFAYDSTNALLAKVTSCIFNIATQSNPEIKSVRLTGKLMYKFGIAPEKYPANHAEFTLQLTQSKTYSPVLIKKMGTTGSKGGIDGSKYYISGVTDENGLFDVDLPLSEIDTGDQYVRFYINNVHYKDLTDNIPVALNYKIKNEKTGKLEQGPSKDSLYLGEFMTDAWGYSVKVIMGKGFPEFYYDTLTKKIADKSIGIDKLTIDAKSKVAAGMVVKIYRKQKQNFIPFYEAGKQVKGNGIPTELPVAEGKTFIEKDLKGNNRTVVVFDKLLLNFSESDEYFIRAVLNKPASKTTSGAHKTYSPFGSKATKTAGSNLDEELEAPEQAFKFITKPKSGSYNQFEMDYKLISKTPPLSKVSGKLVYVWPTEPGVVRPLGNAKFRIKVQYIMDGKALPPSMISKDACTLELWGFEGQDGDKSPDLNASAYENGLVVGEGTTDKDGNFKINIINHNTKGILSNDIYWQSLATIPSGHCEKHTPANENPLDKLKWFENEEWGTDMLGKKGLDVLGNVLDFGMDGLNGKSAIGGDFGFNPNASVLGNMGDGAAGMGAGLKGGKMNKGMGPLPFENEMFETAAGPYMLERVFTLELEPAWDVYYDKPMGQISSGISNHFVVQAFQDTGIGTFTAKVDERRIPNKITVKIKGGNEKFLSGAKLVVFRVPDANVKLMPDGEGTEEHPMKKLLTATYQGNPSIDEGYYDFNETSEMEWIRDKPIAISFGNIFELGDKKITNLGGKYYYQISPDPTNTGATFEPIIRPIETDNVTVKLYPSRVAGRALDASSSKGLKNAKVKIKITKKNGTFKEYSIPVYDTSGYFEAINGKYIPWVGTPTWEDQDNIQITVSAVGFKYKLKSKVMDAYGFQFVEAYALEPGGKIIGKVVDENGKPVEAYIVREDKTVFENKVTYGFKKMGTIMVPLILGGDFEIPVQGVSIQKLKIIPKDVGFFDTSLEVPVFFKANTGDITVYRRKHRILLNLKLKNADGTDVILPITGFPKKRFKATVNNDEVLVAFNSGSSIYLEFENVSVSQYSILIEDVLVGNYTPLKLNISNKESRDPVDYYVTLKKGFTITGIVKLNGSGVKNARVYVDHKTASGLKGNKTAFSELETRSNADGSYEIRGIPGGLSKITLYATLDTTFTVNGDSKTVLISGASTTADFNLSTVDGIKISELFGFKFSIESIEKSKGNWLVTGLVDLGGNTSSFEWLEPNTKVRVRNVVFTNEGGTGVPAFKSVSLESTPLIKMKYLDKYNINLASSNTFSFTPSSLILYGQGKMGYVKAYAKMVDNSFNFPSTYLSFPKNSEFYLGIKESENSEPQTQIQAISSEGKPKPVFYLSNATGGSNEFKFIGFKAVADSKKSYIDEGGKIHLAATVTGSIPNSSQGVVNFFVPDLVLDNNKVYPAVGSEPLQFKLQDWTLLVNKWSIDPTEGGIVSKECLIKTGVVDVPAKTFNLRSDMFVLKDFKLNEIYLGGNVLQLKNVSSNATLIFDEKCGSDLSPHWRLSIAKNGAFPAARIEKLSPYFSSEIQLEYIQLISNGDNILTLMNATNPMTNVFGNPLVKFYPKSLTSGADNFSVFGDGVIDVPRVSALNMGITFSRPSGTLVAIVDPLNFSFEGLGYVKFSTDGKTSPAIDQTNGVWVVTGSVVEPGKFNPIPCTLEFGKSKPGRIKLKQGYKLALVSSSPGEASSGLSLTIGTDISKNGMWVQGADWNNLRFSGELNDPQSGAMAEKKPVFDFVVYGDIEVNSDELKVSQIATPFGNLDMTYDFAAKEIRGILVIPDGTPMGSWEFGGDLELRFSPKGFLVTGAGSLNTGTLFVDGFGTFNMGFLLANYSYDDVIITKVTQFAKDPKGQCWLKDNQSNFKGFYFVGSYDVINESEEFDIAVASMYFSAIVGVEAALGANFANSNYKFSIGGHGKMQAGMSAITGTSISGELNVHVTAAAAYTGGAMSLAGDANLTLGFEVCQSYAVDEVCWSESKEAGLDFVLKKGGTKMDFHMGDPGTGPVCP